LAEPAFFGACPDLPIRIQDMHKTVLLPLILLALARTPAHSSSPGGCVEPFGELARGGARTAESASAQSNLAYPELIDGLENFIREGKAEDVREIFDEKVIQRIKAGEKLNSILYNFGDDWRASLASAPDKPIPFELHLPHPGGEDMASKIGFSAYGNDLFLDGYFYNNGLEKRGTTRELVAKQPWLRWHPEKKSFSLERGNASEALLNKWYSTQKGAEVTIYRGLTQKEEQPLLEVFQALSGKDKVNGPAVAAKWREAYKYWLEDLKIRGDVPEAEKNFPAQFGTRFEEAASALEKTTAADASLSEKLEKLVAEGQAFVGRDAFFFSNDLLTSSKWAGENSLPLVAVTLSKQELLDFAASHDLYVGIEGRGLELALDSPASQRPFFEHWKNQQILKGWNSRAD
jgi:hypothetical protein